MNNQTTISSSAKVGKRKTVFQEIGWSDRILRKEFELADNENDSWSSPWIAAEDVGHIACASGRY